AEQARRIIRGLQAAFAGGIVVVHLRVHPAHGVEDLIRVRGVGITKVGDIALRGGRSHWGSAHAHHRGGGGAQHSGGKFLQTCRESHGKFFPFMRFTPVRCILHENNLSTREPQKLLTQLTEKPPLAAGARGGQTASGPQILFNGQYLRKR
ncbi:hypothetical protein CW670_11945, partial [Macrococcoides caseolyticum]